VSRRLEFMTDSRVHIDCGFLSVVSNGMRRRSTRLLLSAVLHSVTLAALFPLQMAHAQSAAPASSANAEERADEVARIVAGIISFTHWPSDNRVVRLCVVIPAIYADRLIQLAANADRSVIAKRYVVSDARLETDCDVVYIETVDETASQELFRRLIGRPVVSIGDGSEACAQGSLFCLKRLSGAITFAANLDAISRSGLRINPNVLLLARKESIK
jgi:hypothetical protein